MWVSQTNVYLIGIDEDDDRIFIQSNSSIPTVREIFIQFLLIRNFNSSLVTRLVMIAKITHSGSYSFIAKSEIA